MSKFVVTQGTIVTGHTAAKRLPIVYAACMPSLSPGPGHVMTCHVTIPHPLSEFRSISHSYAHVHVVTHPCGMVNSRILSRPNYLGGWYWNVIESSSLEGMGWIDLVQDGDKWRSLPDTVLNLRFCYSGDNCVASCGNISCSRNTVPRGFSRI